MRFSIGFAVVSVQQAAERGYAMACLVVGSLSSYSPCNMCAVKLYNAKNAARGVFFFTHALV